MASARALTLLTLVAILTFGLGQDSPDEGMVGTNQAADLILNSGTGKRVLANGVDILATFNSLETLIQAQAAIILTMNSTVVAQAAILAALGGAHSTVTPPTCPSDVITSLEWFPNLDGRGLTAVNFCGVLSISGHLNLANNQLTSIAFGLLTSIGGFVNLNNNFLTSVDFGSLAHVAGPFNLNTNMLTSITFASLKYVGGFLDLGNNKLGSVVFDNTLDITDTIFVCDNPDTFLLLIDCQALYAAKCYPQAVCT